MPSVSLLNCTTNFLYQIFQGTVTVQAQDWARQRREPCLMPCEIAALARAVVVVRRPLDELFRLLMHRAARRDSISAEPPSLPRTQALQANRRRDVQKYH